jgi:hypothetical protein
MVGSMGPAVSGVGRGSKVAAIHLAALVVGALGTALVLALLGAALRAAKLGWLPVALVGISVLLGVLQVAGVPAVQSRWQVPERWRRLMDVDVLAAFYGLLLGVGGLTAVVVSAFWIFAALSLVVDPRIVVLGWVSYAVVRGVGFWILGRGRGPELYPRITSSRFLVALATLVGMVAASVEVLAHSA